ncbi:MULTISPECIES: hypothetical protein [unclassified Pseudomonas]|uniref:hypothetical protein n=1 Tax=unclassified Pseudomonas TaxID=196821 RepID=UPI000D3CE12B|nr:MULTISPECIES: hypothetical protein [unclassified Pseudomonas]RAU47866.1 hypothetical protein DBP26_004725 [Pseudomonas sp. RIT 409]RAU55440.1 hypothetical protein DBY65_005940 [Pseudomonas sp. RIT 412]
MNTNKLKNAAVKLEEQLERYSKKDPEVMALYSDLKPLLERSKTGTLLGSIEIGQVPGRYRFTERNLQQYAELEEAYAHFSIEVTGGETLALKLFRESMKKK